MGYRSLSYSLHHPTDETLEVRNFDYCRRSGFTWTSFCSAGSTEWHVAGEEVVINSTTLVSERGKKNTTVGEAQHFHLSLSFPSFSTISSLFSPASFSSQVLTLRWWCGLMYRWKTPKSWKTKFTNNFIVWIIILIPWGYQRCRGLWWCRVVQTVKLS